MYAGYKPKRLKAKYKPKRNVAKTALVSRVRKLERKTAGVEYNFLDTTVASAAVATTPTLSQLVNMTQGSAPGQHNGDSITITSIYLNGVISTATAGDNNLVRLICYQDRQANQAAAALGDILLDGGASVHVFSPLNLDNKHRFKILWDKTFEVNDTGRATCVWKKYIKCNIKIRYDGNAGTAADITSNNIGFFFGGFTSLGDIALTSRVRYLDS